MIETTTHGNVRELRLDRPPANALNTELVSALLEAVRRAPEEGARALVLSGREGLFSGGLDVPELLGASREEMRALWGTFFDLTEALAASPIPVAAALNGHAPAGGCVLALFCDHRILAEGKYRIGLNEVQVGLRMPRPIVVAARFVVGARQAARMATTAELLSADEALRIGLVDELAPLGEVVERAVAWATRVSALPPIALRKTRAIARRDLVEAFSGRDEEQLELFLDEWFGEETQGAMRALVDSLAARQKG